MKRASPEQSEAQILMRALRDTNLPKFVAADFGIFKGLIDDLFPRVEAPPQTDPNLVAAIKKVLLPQNELSTVQQEPEFVTKISNLKEMMGVRHCVFVLGCAGSAKSELWKTLVDAQTELKEGGGRTLVACLNPKAVTSDDLYGYMHPVTKDPHDGIISLIMRTFSKNTSPVPKFIVLDGDIDAEWIESMNTVMDDNKVLTLVSNERIPLSASMRMIFEISHLRNASPATVSRAGVIFLNEYDIGWRPYVQTWVDTLGADSQLDSKTKLMIEQLFEQYVPVALEWLKSSKAQSVTPLMDFALVEKLCNLLWGLLHASGLLHQADAEHKEVYETYFQLASIWAFGGALSSDKAKDHRKVRGRVANPNPNPNPNLT